MLLSIYYTSKRICVDLLWLAAEAAAHLGSKHQQSQDVYSLYYDSSVGLIPTNLSKGLD